MNTEAVKVITDCIHGVLLAMGFTAVVEPEETVTKGLVFNISLGHDSFLLIGHRGGHLHAFEILVQAVVSRRMGGEYPRFSFDVDDYRRKREWYIKETVRAAVVHIKKTGRAAALVPMPNYERKLVHAFIQESFPEVTSSSSGFEPRRRVVIRLK